MATKKKDKQENYDVIEFPKLETRLVEYCNNVLSGKIITCKKYKWACSRFLDDLRKSYNGESEWVFIESQAVRYLQFMTCFKHANGDLAGERKIPIDYELFVYSNIYGWYSKIDNTRRFRRSYEQLARKNAKSQDKGLQALYEIGFFGEQKAEAYIAATKKDQTRHVWGQSKWLFENALFPEIKEMFICKFDDEFMTKVIKHVDSGGIFARLSKDDKHGDGANPSFMVLDEYHLHDTTEYYDLGTSGMKTRKNPLMTIITTAGFDLSSPCYTVEYDYVTKILNPDIDIINDRYFVAICELDKNELSESIKTEDGRTIKPGGYIDKLDSDEAIIKSNPILGYSENSKKNIKLEIAEALDKPEKMRDVLTKTLNVWVSMKENGYMDLTKWSNCAYKYQTTKSKHEEFFDLIKAKTDLTCNVGGDFSAKHDLTSVNFEFTDANNKYYLYNISFMPEETLSQHIERDRVPYNVWVDQGWLIVTNGAIVDIEFVEDWIYKISNSQGWKIKAIGLDPWGTLQMSIRMRQKGYNPIEIRQSMAMLSEPTKNFRESVYMNKVVHCDSPLFNWSIGNAVEYVDKNENIMLTKNKSSNRIDPVASAVNSHKLSYVDVSTHSVYEKRGVRVLSF